MPKYLARLLSLHTMDELRAEMTQLQVDRGGMPIMSAKGILRLIRVDGVPTPAANLIKQEILARGGDLATPWTASTFAAPTVDVIFIGSVTTLRSTLSKLYRQRVFDLPAIADAVQAVLVHTVPGYLPVSPRPNRQGVVVEETLEDLAGGRIPLSPGSHRATGVPALAGEPWPLGRATGLAAPVADLPGAEAAAAAGATALCLQGEMANPQVVRLLAQRFPHLRLVLDWAGDGASRIALQAGAQVLRGDDPQLFLPLAEAEGLALWLYRLRPEMEVDPVADASRFFWEGLQTAEALGISSERIILGLAAESTATAEPLRQVMRRLRDLTSFGRPLWLAPFAPDQDWAVEEAAPLVTMAVAGGVDLIETNMVNPLTRCVRMADELIRRHSPVG